MILCHKDPKNTSIPMKVSTPKIENVNKELRKSNLQLENWIIKGDITLYEHT
jgi:hypothetical protein